MLIREHRNFALPVYPRIGESGRPDPTLVGLLARATEARAAMLADRDRPVSELARGMRVGPSYFARLLRLNYLAPDIQTAIIDGTHPPGLTKQRLV